MDDLVKEDVCREREGGRGEEYKKNMRRRDEVRLNRSEKAETRCLSDFDYPIPTCFE